MRRLIGLCLLFPPVAAAQPPAKYAEAIKGLEILIERERQENGIPAISVAIVEDQTILWAKGFGHADLARTKPATADTVYRAGALAVPLTYIAVLQLVDQGKLDLDQPVSNYLPDFKPDNPFRTAITLRHLMTHRSGLVSEPPSGNRYDPTSPSLEATVASLNGSRLLFEPGTAFRHSDAGQAVVGRILEKADGRQYARIIRDALLKPMKMTSSDIGRTPEVTKSVADGLMWTLHGREFTAPTFDIGNAPVGGLYSTATDLGRFAAAVLGHLGGLVSPAAAKKVVSPQLPDPGDVSGFSLGGFFVWRGPDWTEVRHCASVYGFTTQFSLLPADRIGVVVLANKGAMNGAVERVAQFAMRSLLAARTGKAAPLSAALSPVPQATARKLAGKYGTAPAHELIEMGGGLFYLAPNDDMLNRVWQQGDMFVTRGPGGGGWEFKADGRALRFSGENEADLLRRPDVETAPPETLLALRPLIGEYGWDHHILQVFEKDGQLHLLADWVSLVTLRSPEGDTFSLPNHTGTYRQLGILFRRGADGKGNEIVIDGIKFPRRTLDGEDGKTFRIKPLKTMDVLRGEAEAAKPPGEIGEFRKPDLVEVVTLDPTIKTDLRYASDNNFMGRPLYPKTAKAYMQRPAAAAVVAANKALAKKGYGLWVFDAYRPWRVTKMFWEATPDAMRTFVADPSKGSRHNRGCAVDLTLYELKTGKPIEMVSGYDEFSDRAYPNYWGGTSRQRWHRELLRHTMEDVGFTVYEAEWWHFDYKDWKQYRIGNQGFEELEELTRRRKDAKEDQ
ncbi:MAG TPA: serine hydrolase [Gemmataceae bacterium]|nr:serine hydrolase [Gemmataceae bacterium]